MCKNLMSVVLFLVLACFLAPINASPKSGLSNDQIKRRLTYLVGVKSFSTSQPLSQQRLMKLIVELASWGTYPPNDIQNKSWDSPPRGFDEYITRSTAKRFVHDLLNQDLQVWYYKSDSVLPIMVGDKLGWYLNTSNSMSERPSVHVVSEKHNSTGDTEVRFNIFHRAGKLDSGPPNKKIGSGTAILLKSHKNWYVASWQIHRNRDWSYLMSE